MKLTVKTGQAYSQDSINELIILKMNPLVVPVTGVKGPIVYYVPGGGGGGGFGGGVQF